MHNIDISVNIPSVMKKEIHPTYYPDARVTCACGNSFTTGATVKQIQVELCSACHPFYTGKQKLVDTARRVEKFQAKVKAKDTKTDRKGKKAKRVKRAASKAVAKKISAKKETAKKASAKKTTAKKVKK